MSQFGKMQALRSQVKHALREYGSQGSSGAVHFQPFCTAVQQAKSARSLRALTQLLTASSETTTTFSGTFARMLCHWVKQHTSSCTQMCCSM